MSDDDVLLWVDGTWCYREELEFNAHLSFDYRVIAQGSDEWKAFPCWPDKHPGAGF